MRAIEFSRRLAYVAGIATPLAETIRRWSTWQQTPANFFDDYLMGAFLIYSAGRTGNDVRSGRPYLAAAWAFACGLGYFSFFGHLQGLSRNEPDPAPIPSVWVLVIKGVAWAIAILMLFMTLKSSSETSD